MVHWNGGIACAVDVEATGDEAGYHEVCQIAILPLDSNLSVRKDINPFYINIKPDNPERADRDAMRVNGLSLNELGTKGIDSIAAIDLFRKWYEKHVPLDKSGNYQTKIRVVGYNVAAYDKGMIDKWLLKGGLRFYDFFHYHIADAMVIADYINTRYAIRGYDIPFKKLSQSWVARHLGIEVLNAHDALADCTVVAQIYKQLLNRAENAFF